MIVTDTFTISTERNFANVLSNQLTRQFGFRLSNKDGIISMVLVISFALTFYHCFPTFLNQTRLFGEAVFGLRDKEDRRDQRKTNSTQKKLRAKSENIVIG